MQDLSLTLYLTGKFAPQLVRAEFSHPSLKRKLITVRGKTSGAYASYYGTFQWTQAVQALTRYLIEIAAWVRESDTRELPLLTGAPAQSLDFALGKPPGWLIDMFGCDKFGIPLAKKLFKRSNPEGRRAGEVALALNLSLLDPRAIKVLCDSRELCERDELYGLLGRPQGTAASTFEVNSLVGIFDRELRSVLSHTDIFSFAGERSTLSRIYGERTFAKLIGKAGKISSDIDSALSPSEKLGAADRAAIHNKICAAGPLRVAFQGGMAAATGIFSYLNSQNFSFILDYNYQHAVEIMRKILAGTIYPEPDLCVMGIAPAARMISVGARSGYRPLMILPGMSHRVLGSGDSNLKPGLNGAEYHLLNSDPSTSSFYFDALSESGRIKSSKIKITHADPPDIINALQNGDEQTRAIAFFPYYDLALENKNCALVDAPQQHENIKESILFARESLWSDPLRLRCLDIAIRDAWLRLREDSTARRYSLQLAVQNNDFLTFLHRCSGT